MTDTGFLVILMFLLAVLRSDDPDLYDVLDQKRMEYIQENYKP